MTTNNPLYSEIKGMTFQEFKVFGFAEGLNDEEQKYFYDLFVNVLKSCFEGGITIDEEKVKYGDTFTSIVPIMRYVIEEYGNVDYISFINTFNSVELTSDDDIAIEQEKGEDKTAMECTIIANKIIQKLRA